MDRRVFLDVAALAILSASITAEAQPARVYKIGYLGMAAGPAPSTQAFRQGLRERRCPGAKQAQSLRATQLLDSRRSGRQRIQMRERR